MTLGCSMLRGLCMVSTPIELLNEEPEINDTRYSKAFNLFCNNVANLQPKQQSELDLNYLNSLVWDDELEKKADSISNTRSEISTSSSNL